MTPSMRSYWSCRYTPSKPLGGDTGRMRSFIRSTSGMGEPPWQQRKITTLHYAALTPTSSGTDHGDPVHDALFVVVGGRVVPDEEVVHRREAVEVLLHAR